MFWIIIWLAFFILFILFTIAVIRTITLFYGGPFVQSSQSKIKTVEKICQKKTFKKIADLGSGDGKLSFALAPYAKEVHGYEINPLLVFKAKRLAKKKGLDHKVFFHWQNFWKVNFASFDGIVFYQISYVMNELEKKVIKECKPQTMIISNYFKFPYLKPLKSVNEIRIYQL